MLAPVAGSVLLGIACTLSHMGWDGGEATLPALLAVGKSASLFSIDCADQKDSVRKSLAISGLLMLGLAVGGCAPLMVASVEASVDLAAYEYAKARGPMGAAPQAQLRAQPKLSPKDIE